VYLSRIVLRSSCGVSERGQKALHMHGAMSFDSLNSMFTKVMLLRPFSDTKVYPCSALSLALFVGIIGFNHHLTYMHVSFQQPHDTILSIRGTEAS
jgi:hypothetical protein